MMLSSGKRFRATLQKSKPLQIVGTVNAYCAKLATQAGFEAIYLSGGALAAVSYGLPDLGITNLNDVLTDVDRITSSVDTPLIVDIDTGWGNDFTIARAIQALIKHGAAGVHIEDQVNEKRCGHRPNKRLVSEEEMLGRIRAADQARKENDPDFYLIARTDAVAVEGLKSAIARAVQYQTAGADALFAESCTTLEEFHAFVKALDIPVLANITEFGKTPLFTVEELASRGISMILYPFTAVRVMNKAAQEAYKTLKSHGSQKSLIPQMETRDTLYDVLNYLAYEDKSQR